MIKLCAHVVPHLACTRCRLTTVHGSGEHAPCHHAGPAAWVSVRAAREVT